MDLPIEVLYPLRQHQQEYPIPVPPAVEERLTVNAIIRHWVSADIYKYAPVRIFEACVGTGAHRRDFYAHGWPESVGRPALTVTTQQPKDCLLQGATILELIEDDEGGLDMLSHIPLSMNAGDVLVLHHVLEYLPNHVVCRFLHKVVQTRCFDLCILTTSPDQTYDMQDLNLDRAPLRPLNSRMLPLRAFASTRFADDKSYLTLISASHGNVFDTKPPLWLAELCSSILIVVELRCSTLHLLPLFLSYLSGFRYPTHKIGLYFLSVQDEVDPQDEGPMGAALLVLGQWLDMCRSKYKEARIVPVSDLSWLRMTWETALVHACGSKNGSTGYDYFMATHLSHFLHASWLSAAVATSLPVVTPFLCDGLYPGGRLSALDAHPTQREDIVRHRLRGMVEVETVESGTWLAHLRPVRKTRSRAMIPNFLDHTTNVPLHRTWSEKCKAACLSRYMDCRQVWGVAVDLDTRERTLSLLGLLEKFMWTD
jgi:hypothetical protein